MPSQKYNLNIIDEYCNAGTKCDKSSLLKSIYGNLNMKFSSVNPIGQLNLFSTDQYKEQVIQPIMKNNSHLKQEQIRSSDVFACCKKLYVNIKKNSNKLVIKLVFMILSLTAVVTYDCIKQKQENDQIPVIIIPQIIQGILWIMSLTMHIIGITKCIPKFVKIGICFGVINWLYSILVVIIYSSTGFALFDHDNASFTAQIITVVMTFLGILTMKAENTYIKRFLVLLKQLDESELNNKFFLF